jgi:flagellin
MPLSINTNHAALAAQRAVANSQTDAATTMERLATGLRINSAKDDASGLAVVSRLTSQIDGLSQASRNASDAVSMLQTAEGGLQSMTENLQRMRELAIQAATDSISDTERGYLNLEYRQLIDEIDRLAEATKFGDVQILNGGGQPGVGKFFEFQIGQGTTDLDSLRFFVSDMNKDELGQAKLADGTDDPAKPAISGTFISSRLLTDLAIDSIDRALGTVLSERAAMGSYQVRFQQVLDNNLVATEHAQAARGRIEDADFAAESTKLAKSQVLQQSGIAMLGQANAMPQQVLALINN